MNIATRFAAVASVLVVISAFTIGAILLGTNAELLISQARSELSFGIKQSNHDLHDSAELARSEVRFLAEIPQVQELAEAELNPAREKQLVDELAQVFYSLALASPNILQIRLIGADTGGREIVRINRSENLVARVAEADLQEKGDTDYVRDTLRAAPGATLLFGIDLNREHGIIEEPRIPVLRVTTPIYARSGQIYGMIVININMNNVLETMRSRFRPEVAFYLANSDGAYIIHPDPAKAFGFEYGRSFRMVDEFPELSAFVSSGHHEDNNVLNLGTAGRQIVHISRETLVATSGRQVFITAAMLPVAAVFDAGFNSQIAILALTLFLAVFGAITAIVTSKWLVEPLRSLSRAARKLAQSEDIESLDIGAQRDDEVGVLARSFTDMAHTLQDRQTRLEEKEERIRAILETAGTPILSIDRSGIIQSANSATTKLLGYQRHEMIGSNVSMLMNEHDRARHDKYLSDYLKTGQASIIGVGREVAAQNKDGELIPIHLSVTAVKLREGTVYTGVMTDLREQKKINRLKDEFVSTVSHELRTPLTSIKGSLGLLKSEMFGELPGGMVQLIDIAHANSERLSRLVDDILDIEKIAAGKLSFAMEHVTLCSFLKRMIQVNAGYAHAHDVSLRLVECPESLGIDADPDRLTQVVSNLISNAVKFTPAEGVVTVSAHAGKKCIRIEVTDQGPGVPEDFRDKIFSKFAQADASNTRSPGGTGLGLAISRAIVDAHHGSIGFEDAKDGGSTFFVELPQRQPGTGRKKSEPPAPFAGAA